MSNSNSGDLDILVPSLPESVTTATVAEWHKQEGDSIQENEILLEIETDKIMLEIPAPKSGILTVILEKEGSIVVSGQVLGSLKLIDSSENNQSSMQQTIYEKNQKTSILPEHIDNDASFQAQNKVDITFSPSIRKLITEYNLNTKDIIDCGIKGSLTRQDIENYIQKKQLLKTENKENNDFIHHTHNNMNHKNITDIHVENNNINARQDTRIRMNRLQQKVSERLLHSKNSMAMLTTFNEVNMQYIIELRHKYQELFEKCHNTKLGFMSFYVKAVLEGLRNFPEINAYIDGKDIVYHNYFDISIAIATNRGLVTPVLRNVDKLSFSDIEKKIKSLAEKARQGKLTIEELIGGNFTITNGGVFGSMMSTPIINPPQSAILGMHAIKERPVALNGQVIILPMMYLALSYDHRLIDGKDAIGFLNTVKTIIENPIRLLLNI